MSLHLSIWIETSAVFVTLCWIMTWEWMSPLGLHVHRHPTDQLTRTHHHPADVREYFQ
jgi:hypothetical protein